MEIPCCPDPAHAGSQVVRAGWYGKPPHRRQRWLCRPSNGAPHRFAETLPRQQAKHAHCLECSTHLETWEGQPGPRRYDFSAREVAHGLKMVAAGSSYRGAAAETRVLAHRPRVANPRSARWRQMKRDPNLDGQIVANWVDTFAPALMEELPQEWPRVVLVDSISFRISTGLRAGMGFYVFAAVSYEKPAGSQYARPVTAHMQAFGRKDASAWEEFFRSLPCTPEVIVTDMDASIRQAARSVFPRIGDPPPDMRMCEWHLKRSIETNLALLSGQPQHPIWLALEKALYSDANWTRFEQEVANAHAAGAPPLRAMTRWLKKYSRHVRAQLATRQPAGPHSIAALESTLRQVSKAFEGNRSSVFGNRERMNLLLGLMTLEMRGQANELEWAEGIRETLGPRRGVADFQRPHDDPFQIPSLVA